jgi:hypothetical protein
MNSSVIFAMLLLAPAAAVVHLRNATKAPSQNATQASAQNASNTSMKRKWVCLASMISTKTTSQIAAGGVTDWAEMQDAEDTCITPGMFSGMTTGSAYLAFQLCGPGTLKIYHTNDGKCSGTPAETITHNATKTLADCKSVTTTEQNYYYDYYYDCAEGNR